MGKYNSIYHENAAIPVLHFFPPQGHMQQLLHVLWSSVFHKHSGRRVVACTQPCMYHLITKSHSYTSGPSHTGHGNYNACIIMRLEIILWSLRSSNTRFHADFPQLESCQVSAHVSAVNTYPLPQIDTSLQFYIFSASV